MLVLSAHGCYEASVVRRETGGLLGFGLDPEGRICAFFLYFGKGGNLK